MTEGHRESPRATGHCLCGAVRYAVQGPLRNVVNCHCSQCLRTHGHYAAYTATEPENLVLLAERSLKWYRSSDKASRGFCGECGASLFWKPAHGRRIGIAAGTLDPPTHLKTVRHVYVLDAGDYYEIADHLERVPRSMDA